MRTTKIAVIWDSWTPKVTNRILRDLLTLKRFFTVRRTSMSVAAKPELKPFLEVLGLPYTDSFSDLGMCRVYIAEGREISEDVLLAIPQEIPHDICYLEPKTKTVPTLTKDPTPYSGFPLPYPGKPIPPTMVPRYYRPQRITEPIFAPYF